MKILNRSNSTKDIKWFANGSENIDIKKTQSDPLIQILITYTRCQEQVKNTKF